MTKKKKQIIDPEEALARRERLQYEYERMRRTSTRPTHPDRSEPCLNESLPYALLTPKE